LSDKWNGVRQKYSKHLQSIPVLDSGCGLRMQLRIHGVSTDIIDRWLDGPWVVRIFVNKRYNTIVTITLDTIECGNPIDMYGNVADIRLQVLIINQVGLEGDN